MIIYDDLMTLREFYSYYIKIQIEERKEIVLINPFYETTDAVRKALSSGYKAIDVKKYEEKEKKLVIRDSLKKYVGYKEEGEEKITDQINESEENRRLNIKTTNKVGTSHWWDDNKQMIEHAAKMGNVGLSILADAGAFHFMRKTTELLEYECSLPKQFNLNLKAFCLYHQKDFDRLSAEQKHDLVNHHSSVMKIEAHYS